MGRKLATKKVRTIIGTHVILNVEDLTPMIIDDLQDMFTRNNPDFANKKRLRLWTGDTSEIVESYLIEEPFMFLPRGALENIEELLKKKQFEMSPILDKTVMGKKLKLKLKKKPWEDQIEPARMLAGAGHAILRGPPGSGKTVILLMAMAEFKLPSLIIVHSKPLMRQWKTRIVEWL